MPYSKGNNSVIGDIALYVGNNLQLCMCTDNTTVGGITLYVEDKGVITLYLDIYLCRKRYTI